MDQIVTILGLRTIRAHCYKNRQWARFSQQATVCQPLVQINKRLEMISMSISRRMAKHT